MKLIRHQSITLFLTVVLLLFLIRPIPATATSSSTSEDAFVTLTFADGSQRVGILPRMDVVVEHAAKGGHRLNFILPDNELEWAAALKFQQVTVRFGNSEWEHLGELFYTAEQRVLCFIPSSSDSHAYTHYNPETEEFALKVRSSVSPFVDVAAGDWFISYVNLCAEKGLLNGVGNNRFDPHGVVSVDEALVMAARILWQTDGGSGALSKGPSPEEFVSYLSEESSFLLLCMQRGGGCSICRFLGFGRHDLPGYARKRGGFLPRIGQISIL